ncbi:aminodeoxychorismate lyase [Ferruginibacter albus]|uniref:aminodeoxychorismate lyase n=1 Tax=Ferruginibacter albus TaxID=2875540 RepID=UPI001CC3DEA8|nr:aminodeoxychorismate lyase [Ferruginibacter albus]UAY50738.1 aminodeoxychorismate lyase [Ferruginibacter albus]
MPVVFTMGNFFNYNGKIYKDGNSILSPDSRALRYGDGLFETIKVKNGEIIFADEHFARLWKGLSILQFSIPPNFTPHFLQEEIIALIKESNLLNARVRLSVFRGEGDLFTIKDNFPNYIIQAWSLAEQAGKWNQEGLIMGICNEVKKSCDVLSNLKHSNYLPNVFAALQVKQQNWNDAVLLNSFNRVCETTIANIFIIKDQVICTPALSEGCVAGVMRKVLLNKLLSANYNVKEAAINKDELLNADEVFVTNSINAIRWVQAIENRKFDNKMTQEIYSSLIL